MQDPSWAVLGEDARDSLPPAGADANRWITELSRVREWGLWREKPGTIAYVLTVEAIVVVMAVLASWPVRIHLDDLIRLAVLGGSAWIYVQLTREPEERRRAAAERAAKPAEHVDQTSVWLLPAAMVLPLPAALLILVFVRSLRFRIARRSPHRFVFTSCTHAASITAVHLLATARPAAAWLAGHRVWQADDGGAAVLRVSVICACILVYAGVQHPLLRGVKAIAAGCSWRSVPSLLLGPWPANRLILLTLSLAASAGVATMSFTVWLLPPTVLPLVIYWTRTEQLKAAMQAELDDITHDANHDSLTGLPNRRLYGPLAQLALLGPAAVLFCDLDRFARWNATLGHLGADELLKAAADNLRRLCRAQDVPGRFGGEELVLVLPGAGAEEAVAVAQRFRQAMEATRLEVRNGTNKLVHIGHTADPDHYDAVYEPCTVTIGIALAPAHGCDLDRLHEVADQATYAGKNAGRNRVVLATQPDSDGYPRFVIQPRDTSGTAPITPPERSNR